MRFYSYDRIHPMAFAVGYPFSVMSRKRERELEVHVPVDSDNEADDEGFMTEEKRLALISEERHKRKLVYLSNLVKRFIRDSVIQVPEEMTRELMEPWRLVAVALVRSGYQIGDEDVRSALRSLYAGQQAGGDPNGIWFVMYVLVIVFRMASSGDYVSPGTMHVIAGTTRDDITSEELYAPVFIRTRTEFFDFLSNFMHLVIRRFDPDGRGRGWSRATLVEQNRWREILPLLKPVPTCVVCLDAYPIDAETWGCPVCSNALICSGCMEEMEGTMTGARCPTCRADILVPADPRSLVGCGILTRVKARQ